MKNQKITTAAQFNRLMSEILAHPDESALGEHLTDDEFVYFSLDQATSEETERIERHIVSCSECLAEMEALVEAAEAWRGPEAEERFKRRQAEILSKARFKLADTEDS